MLQQPAALTCERDPHATVSGFELADQLCEQSLQAQHWHCCCNTSTLYGEFCQLCSEPRNLLRHCQLVPAFFSEVDQNSYMQSIQDCNFALRACTHKSVVACFCDYKQDCLPFLKVFDEQLTLPAVDLGAPTADCTILH